MFVGFFFQQKPDVNFLKCGTLRSNFVVRLMESRDNIERARTAFQVVSKYV